MPAYVPEYLKSKNRQTVFNMFVKNMTLSRAQIVQETEMSFPTVSKAVDFLISRDIVRESKETSLPAKGPGRRRNQLVFNPAAFYALTLAFEGSSVEIGIADLAGGILRKRAPLPTLRRKKNMTNWRIICRRFWQNFPVHCWALVLRCRWM